MTEEKLRMAIKKEFDNENGRLFYLSTNDKKWGNYLIYGSEKYRLTEFDIINMIKILLVDRRAVSTGRKILAVYQDCTDYSKETFENLKKIGLEIEENEPIKSAKTKTI